MRLIVVSLAALASRAFASADTILSAINTIDNSTLALNDGIGGWSGDLLGTLPIIGDSAALLVDIKKGTKTARDSDSLTVDETVQVAGATAQLATDVNTTLETVIQEKPKFDKLLLSPVILGNLKLEQQATDEFSSAVIEKVPEDLQDTAKELVGGIKTSFEKAIGEYDLFD